MVGNDKILSLNVAQFAQATANCFHLGIGLRSAVQQRTQAWHLRRLLCAPRERPRSRRAAEQRDEIASVHSITSSARPSSVSGTVRPKALRASGSLATF